MFDFLRVLIVFFEKNNISYMLSGSMAMSTYTGPRFTRDFDFIVHLKPSDALLLSDYFKEGYYFDEETITEVIKRKGMFNIIDHKSNYKADFIILRDEEFEKIKFERRALIDFLDLKIFVICPEDLLISKLVWIQELQSALQSEDIIQLSKFSELDWEYIWLWVEKLKLNTFGLLKK
jgi:hypothetical protein